MGGARAAGAASANKSDGGVKDGGVKGSGGGGGDGAPPRVAVEYDGKEPAFNSELSGVDEQNSEESVYGIDTKSVTNILKNEANNLNCIKPKDDNVFFNTNKFADYKTYFKSQEPLSFLEREFDWVVRRKNVFLALLGTFTIIFQVVEIETAYEDETHMYRVGWEVIEIMKLCQSILTLILLIMLYDYYQYQILGVKKNWYVSLYEGKRPGNLPRGIWSSSFRWPFIVEFVLLLIHVPPYLDFRYWDVPEGKTNVNVGLKKPFISDVMGVFMCVRLYLWVRVIRDHTSVYTRRRLIYEGGYRERGGPPINFKIACKKHYLKKEALSVFTLLFLGALILAYSTWVSERDYQPKIFNLKDCIWFTIFQTLLCGFRGMAAYTTFGQYVALAIVFFGIIVLSLAIAVVFNAIALSANESWALDWIREYTLKEKERNAATDYLAYWWRYLAVKGATDLPPDEQRRLQSDYYSSSVAMFNKMSGHSGELAQMQDFGVDSALEDAIKNAKLVKTLKSKLLGRADDGEIAPADSTLSTMTTLETKLDAVETQQNRILTLLNDL